MAKKITIIFTDTENITIDECSIDMMGLANLFEIFGGFVEQVKVYSEHAIVYTREDNIRHGLKNTLFLCKCLKSLYMQKVNLTGADTLHHVTRSLTELEILSCVWITDDWSASLQRFPKLEHLTLKNFEIITADSFESVANLSTLILDLEELVENDLKIILQRYAESLKQLELGGHPVPYDYDLVPLNFSKLPNLEYLAF